MSKHLKILAKGNAELLNNHTVIKNFIETLINRLGMQIMGTPVVYSVPLDPKKLESETFLDEGGITTQACGFATLTTSHVAIHTWPLRSEFHLDIYSCKEFDKEKVLSFIFDIFQVTKIQVGDFTEYCDWM